MKPLQGPDAHYSQLYWSDGSLVGMDPLNNALLSLWGLTWGGFGVKPTLASGVAVSALASY